MSEEQLPQRKRIGKALTIIGIVLVLLCSPVTYFVVMALAQGLSTNPARMIFLVGIFAASLGLFLYIIPKKRK